MDLFVTGRLCLFGEHSDWAAQYRSINNLEPGCAIVVGTNQGIYARVEAHHNLLVTTVGKPQLELAMAPDLLLAMAQSKSFYSYVAGVAYQALTRYEVGGLAIDNYLMDLPIQKGLSSSAAMCVLVAQAFNRVYGLGLDLEAEMDLAYWGERTTPSQCGRLDQACAYGNQPILMIFDGQTHTVKPLTIGQDLFLAIVDLAGNKDTQVILAQLNQCYPVADNPQQQAVQEYLSTVNAELVAQAVAALNQGDAAKIGELMCQAQAQFDRAVMPVCPQQLTAPLLHQLLHHAPLQPYIFGCKGVGSQGDGTAQFIAKDRKSRERAIAIIRRDFPRMQCYVLDLRSNLN